MRRVQTRSEYLKLWQRLRACMCPVSVTLCAICLVVPVGSAQTTSNQQPGQSLCTVTNTNPTKIITLGDILQIKATSEQDGLIYAFGATAGTLVVDQNSAQLNTATAPANTSLITVLCSAIDKNGGEKRSTATVVIYPPGTKAQEQPAAQLSMAPTIIQDVKLEPLKSSTRYKFSGVVAPTLSYTTGTQTQTISGGMMALSAVRSAGFCDVGLRQFGLNASASDTSTTKLKASTINVDNNDVKLNFSTGIFGDMRTVSTIK
jgi:hypothetical protein